MLNKKYITILLFHILFSYSIFDHMEDFKIPSSTYIASINSKNLYNFYNPACNNLEQNKYLYSSYGNYFDGILKNQSIYFSINSNSLKKINFSIIRSSIDNIYNTTNAWNDNGDGIIDITEIDYNNITNFDHNTLGIIISKSFMLNEKYKILPIFSDSKIRFGINSKFSFSSLLSEKSFSHSFDLGITYNSSEYFQYTWAPNIGLLIKDFLPISYWTTGQIENKKTSIMIGSSFRFIKNNIATQSYNSIFYINADLDLSDLMHPSIGLEYEFNNNSNLISFQINSSYISHSLGFIIRLKDQVDIAYSFIIPNNNELPSSQKIMIGINTNILNNYIK